ncbi:MAG: YkgJ family cysteine cluster protein [Bacteroidia bacterium]|nr:YkgJ family cysteine cluster protein [Bacteroidia bacterium]
MEEELGQELRRAKDKRAETRKFFARLRKKKPKKLDQYVSEFHDEVFEEIDCLSCANCCKTTSPVFTDRDIERIAKHLRMKPSQFVEEYLHMDEERDYVLNVAPCPFLLPDNCCMIYDVRPKACREYPHTNRKRFHQVLGLTLKNTEICPATARIVSKLAEVNF